MVAHLSEGKTSLLMSCMMLLFRIITFCSNCTYHHHHMAKRQVIDCMITMMIGFIVVFLLVPTSVFLMMVAEGAVTSCPVLFLCMIEQA